MSAQAEPSPPSAPLWRRALRRPWQRALLIYLVCTSIYAAIAGQRLLRPSTDTHFVYLAECWLKRRLDLGGPPPHQNDWAEVEELVLRDGRVLRGQFLRAQPQRFRTLDGKNRDIPPEIIEKRSKKYYVSFPPFPAVLLLPLVALLGHRTNDVLFSVLLAGAAPALLYLGLGRVPLLFRRRAAAANGENDETDEPPLDANAQQRDLFLVLLFALGSVYFFTAVIGQVWFTAHVVASVLAGLFLLCVVPPRWPALAGLLTGALFLTRPQMAAMSLLWLLELLRTEQAAPFDDGRYPLTLARLKALRFSRIVPAILWFALPFLGLVGLGALHNVLRFGQPLEFGHAYLQTMQADNIQRFGLANYQYLSRNLAVALALLPKLLPQPPYVQVSYHGLALWVTTPALLYLLWPEPRPVDIGPGDGPVDVERRSRELRTLLWLTVLPIALAGLLYQNTGYIQFGYRFSLDYMPLLLWLLRIGSGRALDTFCFRALVVFGVGVNLFGAMTFGRMWQFYWNGLFPVM
ncbi:MAG: hypothetical protein U1A78_24480 [Polyangia bacterium]